MVATVGSISVDLAVKSAGFESGFRKAATTVERESGRMATAAKKAQGVIGSFFQGIGTGAALAGVASLSGALAKARKALSDFDDIGDTSRTLGLSTKAFQVFSFAALEAGVSQEKLNAALGIFTKNVGLAASGQGALVTGLQKLNPELLKNIVNAQSQEERLNLVADAMARAGSATERAALATTAFGKGGLEMVRILDQGAAGLDDFQKRAEELGFIVPDELIQRAGALGDELDIITKAIDINLSVALAELGPVLVSAAGGMLEFSREIGAAAAVITDFVKNPSLAKFQKILADGFELNIREGSLADQIQDAVIGRGPGEIVREIDEIRKSIVALKAEADKVIAQGGFGGGFSVEISRAKQLLAELELELKDARVAAKDVDLGPLVKSADEAAAKVAGVGAEIDALKDKTVTINVRTVQTPSGPINVTSLGGLNQPIATNPLTNPIGTKPGKFIDPLGNYDTFGDGGYTGHGPTDRIAGVVHGGEFVLDAETTRRIGVKNLEAISKGVRGYQTGGAVGTVAALTGGQSVLSMIEDNTYHGLMEIRRIVGYLDTLVVDEQATLAAIRELQGAMRDVGRSVSSSVSSSVSEVAEAVTTAMPGTGITPGNAGWFGGFRGVQVNDTSGLYQSYASGGIAFRPSIFGEAGPEAAVPLPDGRSIPVTIDGGARGEVNVAVNYYAASGNPDPSPRSMMEMQDRIRQTVREVMGGL